jgi:hypothetical protein
MDSSPQGTPDRSRAFIIDTHESSFRKRQPPNLSISELMSSLFHLRPERELTKWRGFFAGARWRRADPAPS